MSKHSSLDIKKVLEAIFNENKIDELIQIGANDGVSFDELNLKEIGEVLGVSESRVSQILSSNVKKLRNILFKETEDQNI